MCGFRVCGEQVGSVDEGMRVACVEGTLMALSKGANIASKKNWNCMMCMRLRRNDYLAEHEGGEHQISAQSS